MPTKLEKLRYNVKYVGGSYADAAMSIPIWVGEKAAGLTEKVLGDQTPEGLTKDYTRRNSPIYATRESLRDSLDTKPGVLFLQSNVAAVFPFVFVGMPAAEATQSFLDEYLPNLPEVANYTVNSLTTLAAQMTTAYSIFMANEVRTNKQKYVNEKGKLSPKKIGKGLVNSMKAFLSFDIPYAVSKVGGQSFALHKGLDPWKASGLIDTIAMPLWWIVAAIPLGLRNKVIETTQTKKWDVEKNN